MRTIVVVAGGEHTEQALPPDVGLADIVIAADSGLDLAERLGLSVDLVVGDLDSVSQGALERATDAGIRIERHPIEKDLTDLELAIIASDLAEGDQLIALGGAGGRLDHLVANLAVLTGPLTAGTSVEAWLGATRVQVVRGSAVIEGSVGMTVSLCAWHGPARGVTTKGFRWELRDSTLDAGTALGTSNELTTDNATVSVESGAVTAIAPEAWTLEAIRVVGVTLEDA